ncbi:MAG: 50S ribosomal protein L29 [Bdellovibrionales bacterium]|nr:50S ribosomal protein L29 [Bdellovibrionales bacterium]
MSNKRFKGLKDLTKDELTVKIREAESGLFQSKMQHRTGQLENTGLLWQMRKDLARMKMLFANTLKASGK